MADHDLTKLPKWAQTEIETLRMRVAERDARLAVGPEDSTVFMDPYADVPKPLGDDPTIEFAVGDLYGMRQYIHVSRVRGTEGLRIYASEALAIRPSASNVVEVYNTRLYA
jgi:hypothetical protein